MEKIHRTAENKTTIFIMLHFGVRATEPQQTLNDLVVWRANDSPTRATDTTQPLAQYHFAYQFMTTRTEPIKRLQPLTLTTTLVHSNTCRRIQPLWRRRSDETYPLYFSAAVTASPNTTMT